MPLLVIAVTVALGWLLAIGVETAGGRWRPPMPWRGWRERPLVQRCLVVLAVAWVLPALWLEHTAPGSLARGLKIGLVLVQVIAGLGAGAGALVWAVHAQAAYGLLRDAGLTDDEIRSLHGVHGGSAFDELLPAMTGSQKLARRVAQVQANLKGAGDELLPSTRSAGSGATEATGPTYSISDLVRFYVLSGRGTESGVWLDGYRVLCRVYGVPEDWERDQKARWRAGEWRDQPEPPAPVPFDLHYASHRLAMERLRQVPMRFLTGPGDTELNQAVHARVAAVYEALEGPVRALDAVFFGGVYGAPADRVYPEAELVARYGFPDRATQSEAWFEAL